MHSVGLIHLNLNQIPYPDPHRIINNILAMTITAWFIQGRVWDLRPLEAAMNKAPVPPNTIGVYAMRLAPVATTTMCRIC
jgi:hypothetical protein